MRKLLFAASLMGAAFTASYAHADTIKIGLMAPLTGAFASEGQDMQKVVQLLVEQTNNNGGIDGKQVELIIEDDGSTPRSAATAASRLVSTDVSAVVGTYGSAITEASQDIYDEAGVVQIGTGATSIRLTEKGMELFFRTSPRDDQQARVIDSTIEKLGFDKIVIIHDNSAYAAGLAEESRDLIQKNGTAEIALYDALVPGERDYSAILTKIKGADPQAILFTGYYPEAGLLLRQMNEMGWSVPMLGGDAANNTDLVKIAGVEAAEGYMFVSPPMPGDLDSESAQQYLDAYRAKYNSDPSSIWSVNAGDAYNVIIEAIKAVGPEPQDIADYLHNDLKDYEGLTGSISFDEKGDRVGDLYRLFIVDADGKFVIQPQ